MEPSRDEFLASLASHSLVDREVLRSVDDYARDQERIQQLIDSEARSLRRSAAPRWFSDVQRRLESEKNQLENELESCRRWAQALATVQSELPKRGWYLTGEEPCHLTETLARLSEANDWKAIDNILVAQASEVQINVDRFAQWLAERGVAECCVKRVRLFFENRQSGNHEVATLVGVPLIDELCRYLYDRRDFTTKRSKQPKPEIACRTATQPGVAGPYYGGFVESFGLIHGNVETARLEDENYFNRSAIVHGQMRRSYGPKDSSKVFMVLMFLVFARERDGHWAGGTGETG